MKKTKKLLAMLLAVSMIVVIMAATQVWAEETNTLVDISGTATMSTNGNAYWPVAGAVDGKYPAEENNWADGANDANGHWVSWLAGLWDAKDGQYIQAEFDSIQIIRKIEIIGTNPWAWTGAGKVKNIRLSNDPDFAAYEEMTCTERVAADNATWAQYVDHKSYWSYTGNAAYKYVRVYGTPGPYETMIYGNESDNPDAFIIQEMKVYAEKASAAADISRTATMSTNGNDEFWPVANAVNGIYWENDADETKEYDFAGIYNPDNNAYIQADMGRTQDIKYISVINAHSWGSYGAGKVKSIQLSNDPNFTTYEEMTCVKRVAPNNTEWVDYVDHKSEWQFSGDKAYRYIRLYGTPGSGVTVNGDSSYQAFVIQEMMIYATQKSASLTNVLAGKTPTGASWYSDMTGEKLVDGNNITAAAATGLAVFALDYPVNIERVEIDLRWGGEQSDTDRHYDVYLSNTGTTEGALQLLSSEKNITNTNSHETILLPVDAAGGYQYILIGSSRNFWVLSEARVMSDGIQVQPAEPEKQLQNLALNKRVTVLDKNGNEVTEAYYGLSKERFVDGNTSTEGGVAGGNAAVIDLGNVQKIEYVEAQTRSASEKQRGYNIYLSNEKKWPLEEGGDWIKIGDASPDKIYDPSTVLTYSPNTNKEYRYVLVSGYLETVKDCVSAEIWVMGYDENPTVPDYDTATDTTASAFATADNGDGTYNASFAASDVDLADFNTLKIYFTKLDGSTPVERERYKYPKANLGIEGDGTLSFNVDITNIPDKFNKTELWISADN